MNGYGKNLRLIICVGVAVVCWSIWKGRQGTWLPFNENGHLTPTQLIFFCLPLAPFLVCFAKAAGRKGHGASRSKYTAEGGARGVPKDARLRQWDGRDMST